MSMSTSLCQPAPRILFIHNFPTRFVQLDIETLRKRYSLSECYLPSRRINLAALWREVRAHDLVFGWFATWCTFVPLLLARLAGRPSLLVIGGYDLANLPEIGYGHQRGGLRRWVSRWSMGLANCLVTNAHYSQEEAHRNAKVPKQRVHVIYHGVPDPLGACPEGRRARIALTVGNVERSNLRRKGHEAFVRAAALLPDVEFVLVGAWKDDAIDRLRAIATSNVTFTGRLEEQALLEHYRRASVYVQASTHEGFGLSLAEAMLAGCIPVVTWAGALPEVVGEAGLYVPSHEPAAIARAVQEALSLPQCARLRARERILNYFPLEKRQQSVERLIDGLLSNSVAASSNRGHPR